MSQPQLDKHLARGGAQPVRGWHFGVRKIVGTAGLNLMYGLGPALTRVGFVRRAVARALENLVRENSRKVAGIGKKLPRVQEDRMEMVVTILRTIEKALAEKRLSQTAVRRLLKNLVHGSIMKEEGQKAIRDRFRAQNNVSPPEILLISPTKACNLRCKGCYADSTGTQEHLSWPVLDRLVSDARSLWGSRFIVFSGGEPLVYRDQGQGVLDLAEKYPSTYFMMYTNATLIDDEIARRIGRLGNVMPAISIEGLKEKTDTRRGAGIFDKVVAAMERLRREKVFYGVSITATRENAEEILSDEVIDFYFSRMGALFAWVFHYMPIGRAITLDLIPSPEQRVWLWKRSQELFKDRRLFIADFWNGGAAAQGCIAAGRPGGYMAVCWNGDAVPCVFMPYSPINVNKAFAEGKNLVDVWSHPFFAHLRRWQYDYGYTKDFEASREIKNWMMPCPIRDHYKEFHPWVEKFGLKPLDENADEAVHDPEYLRRMAEYNQAVADLMDPIWNEYYKDRNYKIPPEGRG
jgi:MoaA/NifB/PqqE/SkfB family radical SAM enzyme